MKRSVSILSCVLGALAFVLPAAPALAQDPNLCDLPGEVPDVIVGDLQDVRNYGSSGDYYGFSVGTTSCNVGSCWLKWNSGTNEHPVIAQNMYRIKDGRLDQVGQSWLKHGFFAVSQELCGTGCIGTNGGHLGVNCSDPYSSDLNGQQQNLGPRSEVNPYTGVFPYPFTGIGGTGDATFRRIRVHRDDLDPALNVGATYFVEGHYVTEDDAAAGRGTNNVSWRPINVSPTSYNISLTGSTSREQGAIHAWLALQPSVRMAIVPVPNDGQFFIGADTFANPDGTRSFVYAIQNLNSDRAAREFSISVPQGSIVTNLYFNDVDAHSGEPYDTTDWQATIDYPNSRIVWSTQTHAENPDANAIRWGTVYTFGFDVDNPNWVLASTEIGLFKPEVVPGDGESVLTAQVPVPDACDSDGLCEAGETCANCAADCAGLGPPTGFCGDGICDPSDGENCTNCSDCNGVQDGLAGDRYCCGDGGGENPIPCIDARCKAGSLECEDTGLPFCCGDGNCENGESLCSCEADCGPIPPRELVCGDGVDNDCDGGSDCGDLDCCIHAACATGVDNDNDGFAECDCDDGDASIWTTPSVTGTLLLNDDVTGTMLSWNPPATPGASSVAYETLRSAVLGAFQYTSSCLTDPNPIDLGVSDVDDPDSGEMYQYLIRATNACPGATGVGPLGQDSSSADRGGATCP